MTENDETGGSELAAEVLALQGALAAAQDALAAARAGEAAAIAGMRDAVRAANPGVPGALIDGANAAEIAASLDRGKSIAAEAVAAAAGNGHAAAVKVPAGGQGPPAPDFEGMTAGAKIRYALAQRAAGGN